MRRIALGLVICACAEARSDAAPAVLEDVIVEDEVEPATGLEGPTQMMVLLPLGTELFRAASGYDTIGTQTLSPAGALGAPPPTVAFRVLDRRGTRLRVQTAEPRRQSCGPVLESNPQFEISAWVEASAAQPVLLRDVSIVLSDGRPAVLAPGTAVQPGAEQTSVVDAAGRLLRVQLPDDAVGREYAERDAYRPDAYLALEPETLCLTLHQPAVPGAPVATALSHAEGDATRHRIFHDGVFGCTEQALSGLSTPRRAWEGSELFWPDGETAGHLRDIHTFRFAPRMEPSGLVCFDQEITPGVEAPVCFSRRTIDPAERPQWQGRPRVQARYTDTDPDQRRVIARHRRALRRCWTRSRHLDWHPGGTIALDFGVEPDGTVTYATARPLDTFDGCSVLACFRDVFTTMKFPKTVAPWTGTHEFYLAD